jgi:hypothetical protein
VFKFNDAVTAGRALAVSAGGARRGVLLLRQEGVAGQRLVRLLPRVQLHGAQGHARSTSWAPTSSSPRGRGTSLSSVAPATWRAVSPSPRCAPTGLDKGLYYFRVQAEAADGHQALRVLPLRPCMRW